MTDLTGTRFGRLIVLHKDPRHKSYGWQCLCDCGNRKFVRTVHLTSGFVKSCSCLQRTHHITHGETKTKFYRVWRQIKIRCNPKHAGKFPRYAGRGIAMCSRWDKYENFKADMYPTYKHGLLIDRINNNGNYEPQNCRWVTITLSNSNKSNTKHVTINGVTKPAFIWAKEYKLDEGTFSGRVRAGWTGEKLLSKPRKFYGNVR